MVPGMILQVRTGGKDYEAGPIWAADTIAFERHFHLAAEQILFGESGTRIEYLAWLAHRAMVRLKQAPPEFDTFVDELEAITPVFTGGALFTLTQARRPTERVSMVYDADAGKLELTILENGEIYVTQPGEELEEGKAIEPNRAQRRGSSRSSPSKRGSPGPTSSASAAGS